jgi:hypothetical protein
MSYPTLAYVTDLLWYEWIDNLALRRVYFLESDHYPRRVQELDDITAIQKIPEDEVQKTRPPYVPDPELRETPPAVSLYSVLYQLPESLVTYDTDGATPMERQLTATVDFFDQAVTAQPGFSSSVVAVTIVPDAGRVAKAWMKWYKIESKLRRLRHVKKILRTKIEKEAEGRTDIYDAIKGIVKHSKHEVENAAQTVTTAVTSTAMATTRHLSQSLSNLDVSSSSSSSSRRRRRPSQGGSIDDVDDETNEEDYLVANQQEEDGEQEVEFLQQSDSSSKDGGTGDDDNNNDNGTKVGMKGEKGVTSLWSLWIGKSSKTESKCTIGGVVASNVEDDIELQPIISSADDPIEDPEEVRQKEAKKKFEYEDFDVVQYAKKIGFEEEARLVDIIDGLGIEELRCV